MILKQPLRPVTQQRRSTVVVGAAGVVIAVVALLALGAALGDHARLAVRKARWWWRPPAPAAVRAPAVSIDRLYLRIEWNELARLERKRRAALRVGVLFAEPDDWVAAWIGLNEPEKELLRARVRLKGDWTEHVEGDRWSLRVKLRGEARLFGMKTLSLQPPERRNGIHEWIFHRALRREGVVALRYRFVRLILNGTDLGTYAVEEHFDSRLIEDNGFRAGPILKLDESLFWERRARLGSPTPGTPLVEMADILPFRRSAAELPGPERDAFLHAAGLLAGFRAGELGAAEVFDIAKVAQHYALCDLLGAHHSLEWINLRFFFNPVTARLEPVAFDGDAGRRLNGPAFQDRAGLEGLWRDQAFVRTYLAHLERFSEPSYLEDLFREIGGELARNEALVALEASESELHAEPSPRDIYAANQEVIRSFLRPLRGLRVHISESAGDRIELDVVSFVRLPVEVTALECRGRERVAPATGTVLAAYAPGPVRVDRIRFAVPPRASEQCAPLSDAELEYRVLGTSHLARASVILWPLPNSGRLAPDLLRAPPLSARAQLAELPFVVVEDDAPRVRILPGEWTLDRALVVPPGGQLVVGPGTELELRRGAALLSYAPLEMLGRPEEPIIIRSTGSGQGLLVIDAGPSALEHVHFVGLAAPRGAGWAQTGAVTFYQSPVVMRAVSFVGNRDSDDSLNIVRGKVTLEECRFLDTPGDGIDIDFGSGSIRSSVFENIGGDGIDVSGSTLDLRDITLSGVVDKAVSVGEMSRVRFQGLRIERCGIGLASKDDSELSGQRVTLSDCAVGFTAFRKKAEYPPPSLVVRDYRADRVESLYLLEQGSRLVIDDEELADNARNLRELFYSDDDP